ncbi:MAG: histidine phosphatase family protein [Thioalkalispiraceae bacterium]|jgi:phosphohistidine phosphatase
MDQLYILRHCKSDWSGDLQDNERPLSPRGIDNAGRIGYWMKQNEIIPGEILCSTAKRAQQTAQLVCEGLDYEASRIRYLPDLYLASRSSLLSIIDSYRSCQGPLMIVGHNPGIDELVAYLTSQDLPYTESGKLMTTGSLARFSLAGADKDLHHACELLSITRPSQI